MMPIQGRDAVRGIIVIMIGAGMMMIAIATIIITDQKNLSDSA